MNSQSSVITISYQSIFRVVLVVVGLAFLYSIRQVLGLLILSIILAAAMNPWVTWLQQKRIPRAAAIFIIYLILFIMLGVTIAALIPPIKEQIQQLSIHYPAYYDMIFQEREGRESGSFSSDIIAQFSFGAARTVWDVGGGAFAFFSMLVLVFYMTVSENGLERALGVVVPQRHRSRAFALFDRIQAKLGLWLRAQLFLMVAVGLMTFIGLKALGIKYALLLSLVAGFTELIPFIGPILGAVPALFVALNVSFGKAVAVAFLYVLVQWFENNILVPRFMRRAVGLNPVVVIAAILIGFEFGGVIGAVVAVPIAAAVAVIVTDVLDVQAIEEREFPPAS